jgi:prepilin-type processing-associated H-X9-DG protein
MAERWNLKRLTRVDVLVVGGICLLLLVLVPILAVMPREQAIRRLCAANLAQIGKTMLAYAKDHQSALPRAGGPTTAWGSVAAWTASNRHRAFDLAADGSGGKATISSSFYLLVKYYEAPTRLFICRGDKGTTEFKLSGWGKTIPTNFTLADAWDFGPFLEAFEHCSYSCHIPYGLYPLTTSRDPNLAVAADRNPYLRSPMADALPIAGFRPDIDPFRGTTEQACWGNAIVHARDGQNVLFLDGHVAFEKRSYCGLDSDNIYLISLDAQRGSPIGMVPAWPPALPANERDSVLVHDPDIRGFRRPPLKP